MRNAFAAFFAVASVVIFVLAVAFGLLNLSPFGASSGLFFATGCVLLVLAIVFGPRRLRPKRP